MNIGFAWLEWDFDRNLFTIPGINHSITWYGFLFALGFLFSYFFVLALFRQLLSKRDSTLSSSNIKKKSLEITDKLTLCVVIGTIFGARLGHVFFYEWQYYKNHLVDIFKIWEGGLASHGAVIGIILSMIPYSFWVYKKYQIGFLTILDILVIPASFVACLIRIGNFINQEILGVPTTLPWGIIFLNPIDGPKGIPLHPVQLYEAGFYFLVFLFLFFFWRKQPSLIGAGRFAGLFFLLIFLFRFFIEYLKMPQSDLIEELTYGNVGQLLSIPFIILGVFLLVISFKKKRKSKKQIF